MVDEQNAHTEDAELPSPLEFRKYSEEENRDSEKDEDTKEEEAVQCECPAASAAFLSLSQSPSRPVKLNSHPLPFTEERNITAVLPPFGQK